MRLRALLALIVLAAGCAAPPPAPRPTYQLSDFRSLPGWERARLEPSLQAFLVGCERTGAALRPACEAAREVPAGDEPAARRFFESHFLPYSLAENGSETGLVTGYYEPVLHGSRTPSERNRYPILGVPEDLIVVDLAELKPELRHMRLRGRLQGRRLVPYYTRAEIEAKGDFSAPTIAWTSDPIELFFLQIQGSGQLELEDGERLRLGYADQNGHPYRSLGRYLVERGELALEEASMQGIKTWAARNPEKLRDALNHNASYVFFRELPVLDGPIGALGVPLTPGYSMAVDRRYVPLGAPVYLATADPREELPLERLMVAQDTGGAIRGAVRADFFWGTGPEAGAAAGKMRHPGRMWLLWPRGEAPPKAD